MGSLLSIQQSKDTISVVDSVTGELEDKKEVSWLGQSNLKEAVMSSIYRWFKRILI